MLIFNNNAPIKQKQWINTKVEFEWSKELQKYVEISTDGYWYDGDIALCAFNETGERTMKADGTGDYTALAIWGDNNISSGNNWGALDLYRGISGTNTLIGRLSTSYNDISIQAQSSRNIRIHDDGGNGLYVKEGGNVAISTVTTPNPTARLEVASASLGSISMLEGLGGGAPGNTTGMLNVTTNVGGGKWAAQMRADHSTANGLFIRAGSGTSYYTAYLTGYDENDVHMVVRGDGKVAIGDETAPTAQLHVFTGDSGFSGAIDTDYDEFCLESSGNTGMTILSPAANYGAIVFGDNGDKDMGRIKYYHGDDSMQFFVNNKADDSMRIISSGRVGIGDTAPNGILHVAEANDGGETQLWLINSAGEGSSDETAAIRFGTTGDATPQDMGKIVTGREGVYSSDGARDSFMSFHTSLNASNTEKMRITSAGNVGINDTNPGQLLSVTKGVSGEYITALLNSDAA